MAQFGTVSGINDLNTAFNSMSAAFQSNQALQASTMVGRNVLVPGQSARLEEGGNISAAVDLAAPASRVVVSITDAQGQLVHRVDLGHQSAGLVNIEWDGPGFQWTGYEPGSISDFCGCSSGRPGQFW